MYLQTRSAKLKPISSFSWEGYSDDLSKRLQENPADLEDLYLLKGLMTARSESLKESLIPIADDPVRLERVAFGLRMLEQKINITDLFISHAESKESRSDDKDYIGKLQKEIEKLKNEIFEAESAASKRFEVFFMEAADGFLPENLYQQLIEITEENMAKVADQQTEPKNNN